MALPALFTEAQPTGDDTPADELRRHRALGHAVALCARLPRDYVEVVTPLRFARHFERFLKDGSLPDPEAD